jgi:DNA-binding transcriptional ArsR family regulator
MTRKPTHHGPGAPPLKANVAEMRALAHPLRLRMMELFAEAPRTTKQVADLLGQPPTRLYHHVAALERAGLLKVKETRKNRGTIEKWYESISRTLGSAQVSGARGPTVASKRAVAMTVLEQSRQEVMNAMSRSRAAEPPLLARMVMVAPPARMPEIRRRLYEFVLQIQADYTCDERVTIDDDYERWAMTMTFAPVTPSRS